VRLKFRAVAARAPIFTVNPMENEVFKITDFRKKYYLSEFQLFDGEDFITFIVHSIASCCDNPVMPII